MRSVLIVIVIVVAVFVGYNYMTDAGMLGGRRELPAPSVGTTGKIDVNAARERGAEVGEKVAIAAEKVKDSTQEAALTTKIKAKMVLDDHIKARAIDVTTNGSVVTLAGAVRSVDEHDRAVRLARETDGVTQVVDHLRVERP
jgi:hyperosmotically inducible protein